MPGKVQADEPPIPDRINLEKNVRLKKFTGEYSYGAQVQPLGWKEACRLNHLVIPKSPVDHVGGDLPQDVTGKDFEIIKTMIFFA